MNKIDARKLSPEVLKALRTQAIRLRETLALPWREVARVMGFNTGTVLGWWHRYQADDEAGLVSKKPGRAFLSGRTLTMSQEWAVRTVVTHQTPGARGLPFALWSRRAVRDLIPDEFLNRDFKSRLCNSAPTRMNAGFAG